jgi:hypothetical protein
MRRAERRAGSTALVLATTAPGGDHPRYDTDAATRVSGRPGPRAYMSTAPVEGERWVTRSSPLWIGACAGAAAGSAPRGGRGREE